MRLGRQPGRRQRDRLLRAAAKTDIVGFTPACTNNHPHVVTLLLEAGTKNQHASRRDGVTHRRPNKLDSARLSNKSELLICKTL